MSKLKGINANHVTIQGWMVQELGLKNNELIVFAVIHGLTQYGNSNSFTGSISFLRQWTSSSRSNVSKILSNLVAKEYLIKTMTTHRGVDFPEYSSITDLVVKAMGASKNNDESKSEESEMKSVKEENERSVNKEYGGYTKRTPPVHKEDTPCTQRGHNNIEYTNRVNNSFSLNGSKNDDDDVTADNFKTEKEVFELEPVNNKSKFTPKGKQDFSDYKNKIEFAEHEGIKIPVVSMKLSREFLNRRVALDTFLLQNKITEDDIKVALVEFCKHLNIEESFYFDFKDFKSHFVNWYRRTDKDLLKSKKRTPEVKLSKEAMIRKEFGA